LEQEKNDENLATLVSRRSACRAGSHGSVSGRASTTSRRLPRRHAQGIGSAGLLVGG